MCEMCEYEYDDFDEEEEMQNDENVNTARLLEELRFITIYPEKWDQQLWFVSGKADTEDELTEVPKAPISACGSFGCLAGNTVAREGLDLKWYKESFYSENDRFMGFRWACHSVFTESEEEFEARRAALPAQDRQWVERNSAAISEKAADILGLNYTQQDRLFSGENGLDDLWELAYTATRGGISPEDYEDAKAQREVQRAKEAKEKQDA